jgi:hypothetical protein
LTAKKAYDDTTFNHDDGQQNPNNLHVVSSATMKRSRVLVEHITRSNLNTENLYKAQGKLNNGKKSVTVVVDVVTRWWSTYKSLQRLLELKRAFDMMVLDGTLDRGKVLSESDWEIISSVQKVLKPFMTAQKNLEGEHYVTISTIPGYIGALRKLLQKHVVQQANTVEEKKVHNLVNQLFLDFNVRWRGAFDRVFTGEVTCGAYNRQIGIHPTIWLATALDPRFKHLNCIVHEADKQAIWASLLKVMSTFHERMSDQPIDQIPAAGVNEPSDPLAVDEEDDNELMDLLINAEVGEEEITNSTGDHQASQSFDDKYQDELNEYK